MSPFGCPSFSKQEAREIDGRVGDETSLRPRPRACMLGALRRAKHASLDPASPCRPPPQLAVPGQLTLSISRASATQQGKGPPERYGRIVATRGRDQTEELNQRALMALPATL